VLGKIGRDCVADGIGVRQLRRIAFFEQEVNLEWITAAGKREVHNYPIGPTLHYQVALRGLPQGLDALLKFRLPEYPPIGKS
jgi:hypothetical protein